jgi:prepilin-type N-terminal cleavage/methylation domain-containing protein/prepilin-type processing-associated H-X9-DG protein
MRRKAFTLIELLVVIAIIAILAAILFPVFAQANEAAKKASDLSNVREHATAMAMYQDANDDLYPLGFGADSTGTWRWTYNHYVPDNWPSGPGTDSLYATRIQISPYSFANSMQPFTKSYELLASPGVPQVSGGGVSNAAPGGPKPPADVSYTFNGLLMSYSATAVASPANLPVMWNGRGKAKIKGGSLSNPALKCDAQPNVGCTYVPFVSGCSASINGQQSAMFVLSGSMWVYAKGANFALADGHAKFRRLGAQLSPQNTDWRMDPYTGYNTQGFPGFYWWDGCHAWLFRPDYEFNI